MLADVTAHASSTCLVGREPELATLGAALKRTVGGEPVTVLLGGEAGVGKTRLIAEFLAGTEGASVLTGHCLDLGEQGLPFAPFAAALRALLRRDGPSMFRGYEREFATLLPELRPPGAPGDPLPAVAPGADAPRGYLFGVVADLLGRLAAAQPLILAIEDLHWADSSTRDLLDFLVRATHDVRVLLLITYRSDELHRGHPLRAFLGELDRVRGVQRLEVGRLDREGTARMLTELLGGQPGPAAIDNIHDRAQGNPFFIEELAACGDPEVCCDMPGTLRDLLLSRIDRLWEPAQRVLRVASVGGVRTSHELLVKVAGMDEAELEAAIRAAVVAQLLVPDSDGGYEFRHALVREAVHDDLLPGERVRLHARYAEAIGARPDLVAAGRAPADIARHWYVARNQPRALVSAYGAAGAAAGRYAYAEQSHLLERVLDLWEQVPEAATLLGMDHLRLLEEAATAAANAGEYSRALSRSRVALTEVDSAAQPLRAARLRYQRGLLMHNLGVGDPVAELQQGYDLALRVEGPERIPLLAELAVRLARWDAPCSEWTVGERIVAEALKAAELAGDRETQNAVLLARSHACHTDARVESVIDDLRQVVELSRAVNDPQSLVRAMVNLSDRQFEAGDYLGSQQTAAQGRIDASRFGISRSTGAFLGSNEAEALIALGRWDEADLLCAQADRLDPPGKFAVHWVTLRARLWLARGHPQAGALVARAVGYLGRLHLQHQLTLPLRQLRIEAAVAAGDPQETAAAVRAALTDPGLVTNPRYGWAVLAAVATALPGESDHSAVLALAARLPVRYPAERAAAALTAAALTVGPAAREGWIHTVAAWRADGRPYELARSLVQLARTEADCGDRAGAGASLREAAEIAADLGAVPLLTQARDLGRRVGVPSGAAAGPAGADRSVLTVREVEVLGLVSEGLSNRLIAARLFISPKTASVHVSRIIAKLEVGNRGEAAAVARRRGLLGLPAARLHS